MQIKILIIAAIENQNGDILLRKKLDGSPPYREAWYIFGAELIAGQDIEQTLIAHIQQQAGITIRIKDQIGWDTEVKHDLDGVEKQFVYLDTICEYVSGELQLSEGIEKLEWVPKNNLSEYDNVPPSVKLFKKLGYI